MEHPVRDFHVELKYRNAKKASAEAGFSATHQEAISRGCASGS
jgi:hypothetical protein